ncbi:MAG TPA: 3-deoxy-manno-octulosonate cytidylyltransferase [Syntrophobacteria bacterium]|nr:3-deoxy-manno-octulosonate cytidylyltransferase [Syntrophobacteria bacterium]
MTQAVGIIPARYASNRLPGKPLALIQGRPMIQHVFERAVKARTIQRLLVATDDSRIREAVSSFGAEVLMTSSDHLSGTDRVAEAARQLSLPPETVVVNIQGDEPLLQPEVVDQLVQTLLEAADVPMATLAHSGFGHTDFHDPGVVKVVFDARRRALYFSRAPIPHPREATEPLTYYKHIGLYAFRNAFLQQFTKLAPGVLEQLEKLEQLRALEHGFPILVVPTAYDSVSVDTPLDLMKVEEILEDLSAGSDL